jgi:hypothetical protein
MIHKHQAGEHELRPDGFTFAMVISARLMSKRPDAVSNAQRVYDDMVVSYKSGQRDLEPNIEKFRARIAQARSRTSTGKGA